MSNGQVDQPENPLEGPLLSYPALDDLMDAALLGMEQDIWKQDGLDQLANHKPADPQDRSWSLTTGAEALHAVPRLAQTLENAREKTKLRDFRGLSPLEVMDGKGREMLEQLEEGEKGALRDLLRENLLREMS